jgi:hypothetical protein
MTPEVQNNTVLLGLGLVNFNADAVFGGVDCQQA